MPQFTSLKKQRTLGDPPDRSVTTVSEVEAFTSASQTVKRTKYKLLTTVEKGDVWG